MASRKSASAMPAQVPATSGVIPEPILTIEDIAVRLKVASTRTVYELTRKRNKRANAGDASEKVSAFLLE